MSEIKPPQTQIRNGLQARVPNVRDKGENPTEQKESLLDFATWLRSLESSEHLLNLEAKTSRNVAWCKGVLARWRAAGYPDPELWPETQQCPWLRPSYRLNHAAWPSVHLRERP